MNKERYLEERQEMPRDIVDLGGIQTFDSVFPKIQRAAGKSLAYGVRGPETKSEGTERLLPL